MPTLGEDCHVILAHADIDAGVGYGFISPKDDSIKSEGVQIVREVSSDDAGVRLWVHFDILMADSLINPDGSTHSYTRAEDYAKLLEFLDKPDGITLVCPAGALLRLGALGWTADERHLPSSTIVKVQLNNIGYYFPPIDPDILALSVWDGTLTWETSYWR